MVMIVLWLKNICENITYSVINVKENEKNN